MTSSQVKKTAMLQMQRNLVCARAAREVRIGKEGAEGVGIRASSISRSRNGFCATVINPVSSEMSMASSVVGSSSIQASASIAVSLPTTDILLEKGSTIAVRSTDFQDGRVGDGGC